MKNPERIIVSGNVYLGGSEVIGLIIIAGFAMLIAFAVSSKKGVDEPPPTPVIKDIVQIIEGDGYEIMTVDPATKVVVIRQRWFEKIVADVAPDMNPWAEIKTKGRDGKGNVLHIRTPKEIGAGMTGGKYPVKLKVLDGEK